jgi:hypothetical protein
VTWSPGEPFINLLPAAEGVFTAHTLEGGGTKLNAVRDASDATRLVAPNTTDWQSFTLETPDPSIPTTTFVSAMWPTIRVAPADDYLPACTAEIGLRIGAGAWLDYTPVPVRPEGDHTLFAGTFNGGVARPGGGVWTIADLAAPLEMRWRFYYEGGGSVPKASKAYGDAAYTSTPKSYAAIQEIGSRELRLRRAPVPVITVEGPIWWAHFTPSGGPRSRGRAASCWCCSGR